MARAVGVSAGPAVTRAALPYRHHRIHRACAQRDATRSVSLRRLPEVATRRSPYTAGRPGNPAWRHESPGTPRHTARLPVCPSPHSRRSCFCARSGTSWGYRDRCRRFPQGGYRHRATFGSAYSPSHDATREGFSPPPPDGRRFPAHGHENLPAPTPGPTY